MTRIIILLALVLFVSGCTSPQPVSEEQNGQKIPIDSIAQEQPGVIEENKSRKCIENKRGVCVYDGKIWHYGKERGSIDGNRLTVFLDNNLSAVFDGSIDRLAFWDIGEEVYSVFSYDGIEVSTKVGWPYDIYKPVKGVSYKCDGSLVKDKNGDVPNFYCTTNGMDFLSQYELNAVTGVSFATGGDFGVAWKKIYIRKIADADIFFFAGLKGDYYTFPGVQGSDYDKKVQLSSKDYLDSILKDPENQVNIEKWDEFASKVELAPRQNR